MHRTLTGDHSMIYGYIQIGMQAIIIGNSDSGKPWPTNQLAALIDLKVISLDKLFWEDSGFRQRRPQTKLVQLIPQSPKQTAWVVEGIFVNLVDHYLEDVGLLVWLDIDWPICEQRLYARNAASPCHMDRMLSATDATNRIEWAGTYYSRDDDCAYTKHHALFEHFTRHRHRPQNETDVMKFLAVARTLC
jgi:hypothetical protein